MNDRSEVWTKEFWDKQNFEGKLSPADVAICSSALLRMSAQQVPGFAEQFLNDFSDPVLSDLAISSDPTLRVEGEKLTKFLESKGLSLTPLNAAKKMSTAVALGITQHKIEERCGAHLLFEVWSQFRNVVRDKEGACCLTSPKVPLPVQKYWNTEDMFYEKHLAVTSNSSENVPASEAELSELRSTLQSYAVEIVRAG